MNRYKIIGDIPLAKTNTFGRNVFQLSVILKQIQIQLDPDQLMH